MELGRSGGVREVRGDHSKTLSRTLAGFGLTGHGASRFSCFLEIFETHFITKYLQIGHRASRWVLGSLLTPGASGGTAFGQNPFWKWPQNKYFQGNRETFFFRETSYCLNAFSMFFFSPPPIPILKLSGIVWSIRIPSCTKLAPFWIICLLICWSKMPPTEQRFWIGSQNHFLIPRISCAAKKKRTIGETWWGSWLWVLRVKSWHRMFHQMAPCGTICFFLSDEYLSMVGACLLGIFQKWYLWVLAERGRIGDELEVLQIGKISLVWLVFSDVSHDKIIRNPAHSTRINFQYFESTQNHPLRETRIFVDLWGGWVGWGGDRKNETRNPKISLDSFCQVEAAIKAREIGLS